MVAFSVSSSILQIHSRGVERLFGRTVKRATVEVTWLVFLVTVGVERHRPALLVTEVAQTAEVRRSIPQPLEIFLARFPKHGWIEIGWHGGLSICVDIA